MIFRAFSTTVFCLILANVSLHAQKSKSPTLEDLQRQMMEMQKQMLQELGGMFKDSDGDMMKWDTTFNFQFDTSQGSQDGQSGSFFKVFPFGGDSLSSGRGFPNMDQLFRQLFESDQPGQWYGYPHDKQPVQPLEEEGDLAPEEKLRLQDEPKSNNDKSKDGSKKPKLKTIRI